MNLFEKIFLFGWTLFIIWAWIQTEWEYDISIRESEERLN